MARYNGRSGLVYMSASSSGAATSVGRLSQWTLDMGRNFSDATAFNDANQQYTAGLKNMQGTLAGIWDDTDDAMYDAMGVDDYVKIYLYPSSDVLTKYWYGPANVDMSLDVSVNETIKFTANFAAAGDWGQM